MTPMRERFVEIDRLTKAYPNPTGEPTCVVDGFTAQMREGEFVAIIGHSGCGKSTVLTMVAGLNPITAGNVIVAGRRSTAPGPIAPSCSSRPACCPG